MTLKMLVKVHTKMGIVDDVKQQLRLAGVRKLNYATDPNSL